MWRKVSQQHILRPVFMKHTQEGKHHRKNFTQLVISSYLSDEPISKKSALSSSFWGKHSKLSHCWFFFFGHKIKCNAHHAMHFHESFCHRKVSRKFDLYSQIKMNSHQIFYFVIDQVNWENLNKKIIIIFGTTTQIVYYFFDTLLFY